MIKDPLALALQLWHREQAAVANPQFSVGLGTRWRGTATGARPAAGGGAIIAYSAAKNHSRHRLAPPPPPRPGVGGVWLPLWRSAAAQ